MMSTQDSYIKKLETESENLLTSALASKLLLSFEERIDSHENARQLMHDLLNATKEISAGSQEAS